MSLMILKDNVTAGSFEGNTARFTTTEVFIVSDADNAQVKWGDIGYTVLTPASIPGIDSKYWKRSSETVIAMTQAEQDTINDAENLEDGYDAVERIVRGRINYKTTFIVLTARGLKKDLGYTDTQIEFVLIAISLALSQMGNATLVEARATIDGITPADDFTGAIQTKMLADIDAYLAAE